MFADHMYRCSEINEYLTTISFDAYFRTTNRFIPIPVTPPHFDVFYSLPFSLLNDESQVSLYMAIENGNLDVVQLLILAGVNIETRYWCCRTPLLLAACRKRRDIVKLLIDSGADVESCDEHGLKLLHFASVSGWLDILEILMERGSNVDAKAREGVTALILAADYSQKDVVDLLLDSGADVNYCSRTLVTALHSASNRGGLEVVKSLLEAGADLDAKSLLGDTSLHPACAGNQVEIIQHLLKAGADCNVENGLGITPLNRVINFCPSGELIRFLIENGAYVRPLDYNDIFKNPLLKEDILQDIKVCTQAIVNKFNNDHLPALYKLPMSVENLPRIERMKIGSRSGMAQEIEESVKHEIETKGYCNILETRPILLSILSVKSVLGYYGVTTNERELRKPLRRSTTACS